ncbi:hypothetical protein TYRP_022612 [Tyrophagus putrescentiae]|nr:hypothetical protein TYRP_022612 [Tyrophagus putrescentiae]
MVTSTSTAADNNFSGVAEVDANSSSQQQISLSFAYSAFSYNGQLQLQQHHSQQQPSSNSVLSRPTNFIVNDVSGGGYCGGLFTFKEHISILSKTQTGPIEGVITSFKNELYFLSQIAYSAKNLRILILKAVLLNQKNKNNSNWTRFIQPVTSPQE